MLGRAFGLALTAIIGAGLLYLSRFWTFQLWSKKGLLGISELRPQGGLFGHWLKGSDLAPFELLLWACAVFLLLTFLQCLQQLFASRNNH